MENVYRGTVELRFPRYTSNDLRQFSGGESGAVTADWVLLTAAIFVLGTISYDAVRMRLFNLGGQISSNLSDNSVPAIKDGVAEIHEKP